MKSPWRSKQGVLALQGTDENVIGQWFQVTEGNTLNCIISIFLGKVAFEFSHEGEIVLGTISNKDQLCRPYIIDIGNNIVNMILQKMPKCSFK